MMPLRAAAIAIIEHYAVFGGLFLSHGLYAGLVSVTRMKQRRTKRIAVAVRAVLLLELR